MNTLKYIVLAFVLTALVSCSKKDDNPVDPIITDPNDTIPAPEGWKLVWNDEFYGPEIDETKWEWEVNGNGGGNNELQYYTDKKENSFIEDGHLSIQALKKRLRR